MKEMSLVQLCSPSIWWLPLLLLDSLVISSPWRKFHLYGSNASIVKSLHTSLPFGSILQTFWVKEDCWLTCQPFFPCDPWVSWYSLNLAWASCLGIIHLLTLSVRMCLSGSQSGVPCGKLGDHRGHTNLAWFLERPHVFVQCICINCSGLMTQTAWNIRNNIK